MANHRGALSRILVQTNALIGRNQPTRRNGTDFEKLIKCPLSYVLRFLTKKKHRFDAINIKKEKKVSGSFHNLLMI